MLAPPPTHTRPEPPCHSPSLAPHPPIVHTCRLSLCTSLQPSGGLFTQSRTSLCERKQAVRGVAGSSGWKADRPTSSVKARPVRSSHGQRNSQGLHSGPEVPEDAAARLPAVSDS